MGDRAQLWVMRTLVQGSRQRGPGSRFALAGGPAALSRETFPSSQEVAGGLWWFAAQLLLLSQHRPSESLTPIEGTKRPQCWALPEPQSQGGDGKAQPSLRTYYVLNTCACLGLHLPDKLPLPPFYRGRNGGSEHLRDRPRATSH